MLLLALRFDGESPNPSPNRMRKLVKPEVRLENPFEFRKTVVSELQTFEPKVQSRCRWCLEGEHLSGKVASPWACNGPRRTGLFRSFRGIKRPEDRVVSSLMLPRLKRAIAVQVRIVITVTVRVTVMVIVVVQVPVVVVMTPIQLRL